MRTPVCHRLSAALVAAMLLVAALPLAGCTPEQQAISKSEYLELVHGWVERDTIIREEAFAATTEEGDEAFLELKSKVDELRADVEGVAPPKGFEALQDHFVECEKHFATALEMLGNGEDILAIDELALSKDARLRMQDELEKLDAADI